MGIPNRWWKQQTLCLVGVSLAIGMFSGIRADESVSVRSLEEIRRQVGNIQFLIETEAGKIQPFFDELPASLPMSESEELAVQYGREFANALQSNEKARATEIARQVIAIALKSTDLGDRVEKLLKAHHLFILTLMEVYAVYMAIGGWEEGKHFGREWSVGLPATLAVSLSPVLPVSYWLATNMRRKFKTVMQSFFLGIEKSDHDYALPWTYKRKLAWLQKQVTLDLRTVSHCERMLKALSE